MIRRRPARRRTGTAGKRQRSSWEVTLERHMLLCGIPVPEREYLGIPDRRFRFDFAWPAYRLAVEVQGGIHKGSCGGHTSATGITRDCEKICLAAVEGWTVLPVTPDQIKRGEAVDWIQKCIERRRP